MSGVLSRMRAEVSGVGGAGGSIHVGMMSGVIVRVVAPALPLVAEFVDGSEVTPPD
jgi:hypothetical protein